MRTFGKREWVAVSVALVAAAILFFGGQLWSLVFGSGSNSDTTATTADNSQPAIVVAPEMTAPIASSTTMQNISTVSGLEIYDQTVGTGAEAVNGKTVTVHYIGTLTNGTKFDSSVDRGEPFPFTLGIGQVIKGWDLGVAGMKVGGVRRLVISPDFAYGTRAIGSIPANSTLIFEVQLLDVK